MKIKLIRNATLRVTYAGHTFLIDPYLAPRHSLPSYTGRSPNPLVDLPCAPEEVIGDIEMVIVSHLHSDHFDSVAQELLPKDVPIFCQPGNEGRIGEMGFGRVTAVPNTTHWQNITIRCTPGQHGSSGTILQAMGSVSGFLFQAGGEPTVYWAGDTVWYEAVAETITRYQPDVIITHSSGAVWGDYKELIVMDAAQTIDVCRFAPSSVVVAVHMEALDHGTVTRQALRESARQSGVSERQLLIPDDGQLITQEQLT
jgi:L-ascorbate metabolism protein UlaG (beta-lactamase superfamily)